MYFPDSRMESRALSSERYQWLARHMPLRPRFSPLDHNLEVNACKSYDLAAKSALAMSLGSQCVRLLSCHIAKPSWS